MPNVALVLGLAQVRANLQRREARMAIGLARGLKVAGLKLQRESQKRVPVEYGVLKSSAYTRATGAGFSTVVDVGFTASYAVFVHENVGMVGKGKPRPSGKGNYWDPQPQATAKFLEIPVRTMRLELRKIILDHVRVFG